MRVGLFSVVVGTAIILSACGATSGTKVTDQQWNKIQAGKTTYAQAVALLGAPQSETVMSGGKKIVVYAYSETTTRPETYIPFAGAFVGGADSKSRAVTLSFDANGLLTDTTSSNTTTNATLMGGSHSSSTTTAPNQ